MFIVQVLTFHHFQVIDFVIILFPFSHFFQKLQNPIKFQNISSRLCLLLAQKKTAFRFYLGCGEHLVRTLLAKECGQGLANSSTPMESLQNIMKVPTNSSTPMESLQNIMKVLTNSSTPMESLQNIMKVPTNSSTPMQYLQNIMKVPTNSSTPMESLQIIMKVLTNSSTPWSPLQNNMKVPTNSSTPMESLQIIMKVPTNSSTPWSPLQNIMRYLLIVSRPQGLLKITLRYLLGKNISDLDYFNTNWCFFCCMYECVISKEIFFKSLVLNKSLVHMKEKALSQPSNKLLILISQNRKDNILEVILIYWFLSLTVQ